MSEIEWTQTIATKLAEDIAPYKVSTQQKIPYLQEIASFTASWEPVYRTPESFETDMVVYEEDDGRIIPRVIVESKYEHVTTHDAITYSEKARMHKTIMPYLSYGIMLGNRQSYPLPGRLYRHGVNFDFMFSFKGDIPDKNEWKEFVNLIRREIKSSTDKAEMLHESRKTERKRYFMLEKKLCVE